MSCQYLQVQNGLGKPIVRVVANCQVYARWFQFLQKCCYWHIQYINALLMIRVTSKIYYLQYECVFISWVIELCVYDK